MTFFGEELGLFGSRYYGRHPLFPFKDTVAGINLEQIGRTDDSEGPHVNMANLTGFDYSTVASTLQEMFHHIVAIGADTITRGTEQTGSVLIERMTIAGQ